ncbi:kyphoscoliosis peptidase [Nothobranchius furzeri]
MSAEVAIQKFSFPFKCSVHLSPQEKVTQKECVQVKEPKPTESKQNVNLVKLSPARVVGENQTHGSAKPPPGVDKADTQPTICTDESLTAVVLKQNNSLKGEKEDQHLAVQKASVGNAIAAVKKGLMKTDARGQKRDQQNTRLGQRVPPLAAAVGKRRHRKDLFTSPEVFHRLDSQVIRTGVELKENCVYDVKTIVQSITEGARTELERLRSIWVWLCHNIEYDVSGYLGHSEKLSSPEEVIAAGRGVCCSYSNLCTQMCREMDIECQEVPGYSKGVGYRQGQSLREVKSDHLWNAVLLEGQWFLLDACWGAGQVDLDNKSFVKRFDDFYFLTDPEEFIDSHFPDEERWQLLDMPIPLEEFEGRVFKTSSFFTMGLRLIKPHHFHILTDDGEANVSLGFTKPTIFTYEITQHKDLLHCGASELKEASSSSFGLLTVSLRSMKLQLLPPASGLYDVKLFARPETATTPLVWVCSFTVECPVPKTTEDIPVNPHMSWGLQPFAKSLGVLGSSQGGEVIEVDDGVFELTLKTSRPLMMLCELVHPKMEADLVKRCLATQIQPDTLTCHILCPLRGFYRLSVFVRDYEKTDVKVQNAANFLLHCNGTIAGPDELFPPNLGSACGPGTRTSEAGLSKFSHNTAIVCTQQGKCNITFYNQQDLELHYVLSKENNTTAFPHSRYLFCTYTDSKVTLSLSLPEPGVYRLGLYACNTPGGDFSPMCDFVIKSSCNQPRPPFPNVYSAWVKGCVLFEPRAGLLEPLSWVQFRVRVPRAVRVSVVGETLTDLKLNNTRIWEGKAFSGSGSLELKLVASSGDSTDMAVLMTFDVKLVENEK